MVLATSLAAHGSDAPTADGADSSTTAAPPPNPVAVRTPSSRRRNVAVLPVREGIDNSLWLSHIGAPHRSRSAARKFWKCPTATAIGHPAIHRSAVANPTDKNL